MGGVVVVGYVLGLINWEHFISQKEIIGRNFRTILRVDGNLKMPNHDEKEGRITRIVDRLVYISLFFMDM